MINFILAYVVKSKNFAIGIIGVILFLFIVGFVNNYFDTKYKIKEYQRIEKEVKNQNLNVKENVEIIKKRSNNLNINDRKRLLEKMFSE
jgi:hypothetical protein